MRVLIVVGNYANVVDGVALTYGQVVRHRRAAGDELLVLGPGARRALTVGPEFVGLPSVPIPVQPEYRFALGIPPVIRRKLERFEPDIVHVASPDLAGWAALEFAAAHAVPAVGAYHSEIARYLRFLPVPAPVGVGLERAVWAWVRRFYARCRQVYVPSPSIAAALRRRGLDVELRPWTRGVDTERFDPRKRDLRWRARLGLDDELPLLLFVARLRREKGLDVLAQVLGRLAHSGPPHRSAIAGDGPERARLARRLPGVHMLGALDRDELATTYASADVFVYPSTTETFGNVTLEAMASGLPTVCADATGSDALVIPGETGELVAADDVDAFVRVLAALLRDPVRRRAMATAARARAEAHSWRRAIDQLVGHWREVVGR